MNEDLLPQAVGYLNKQPNGGMLTSSLDDEFNRRNETRLLYNVATDMVLLFIASQEDRKDLDNAGGPKPLTPGSAFHL